MAPIYHIVVVRMIWTSWAHVWRLHFYFLGMGYDTRTLALLPAKETLELFKDLLLEILKQRLWQRIS
jgi:hypothetical protein